MTSQISEENQIDHYWSGMTDVEDGNSWNLLDGDDASDLTQVGLYYWNTEYNQQEPVVRIFLFRIHYGLRTRLRLQKFPGIFP